MNINSIFKPNLFAGKVAIVTGGATGIGAAITQELGHLGCDVIIASRNEERLKNATEKMNKNPKVAGNIYNIPCNIRREEQVQNLMQTVVKNHGKVDFLVNNGDGQFLSPAENISSKGWNAVIDTNLTGTFLCCQHVYHEWMGRNGGTIVNIIANIWRGFPFMSHTAAARSAVDNLTKTLAIEWAEKGIRINSVAPGTIYSETAAANYSQDIFQEAVKMQPTWRLGTPEEISATVCFILSPAAAFMTEQISVKGWNAVINTNLTGTFLCCQHAFKTWMGENGGTIVNIVANMWRGFPLFSHTGAARSAVDNLTKTLALEWADKGIRINSVAPGTIYSDSAAANYPRDVFSEAVKLQPTGRLGCPEEVSGIVCFLLSPAAAFMTGETVKVDGGESLYKCLMQIPKHNRLPAWEWNESKL